MPPRALTSTRTRTRTRTLTLTPTPTLTLSLTRYLLAPYLRVPLLMRFFAQPAHTQALARPALQYLLLTLPLTLALSRALNLAGPRPARAAGDTGRRPLRARR